VLQAVFRLYVPTEVSVHFLSPTAQPVSLFATDHALLGCQALT